MKLRTIFWKNGSCGTEHKVSVVGTPPPLPQQSVICFSRIKYESPPQDVT
jgi:hypothetical protein